MDRDYRTAMKRTFAATQVFNIWPLTQMGDIYTMHFFLQHTAHDEMIMEETPMAHGTGHMCIVRASPWCIPKDRRLILSECEGVAPHTSER